MYEGIVIVVLQLNTVIMFNCILFFYDLFLSFPDHCRMSVMTA